MINVMGLLLAHSPALLAAPREYHYVPLEVNWAQAHNYCRENFGELAAIETEEDWVKLKEMVVQSGWNLVWTGFHDDIEDWRWSMDNTYLHQGGSVPFVLNVDNSGSVDHCVSITGGQLYDNEVTLLWRAL